ncbi:MULTISPECIES: hypothetical protein [unclassified Paenibacillus]|uniref:hypothetical protein n=1 Tax=unclassified Paenibacillus TaxID=185978 RepID=UPI0036B9AEFA
MGTMGWGEFRTIPSHYNEEVRAIDEHILGLVQQRREFAGGKRAVPAPEQMQVFAKQFGLELEQVAMILSGLNDRVQPIFWPEEEEVVGVLPILQKTSQDHCDYSLTHAMQYESYSVVTVEIKYRQKESGNVQLQPNLTLAIIGEREYTVQRHGSRGGGTHAQLQFVVIPALPKELNGIEFSLVPEAMFLENKIKEINLNRQVDFYPSV